MEEQKGQVKPYEAKPKPTEPFFQTKEVDTGLLNRCYKRRGKLERAWDKALEEINATMYKLFAEMPMQGFEEDGLRQIRFNLEISRKGKGFDYSLKHEVA